MPHAASSVLVFDVDPIVLFRFSALTYNAHRIHYDRGYATGEGYPDLVVHGPLQALMMGELIRRSGVPTVGKQFSYRLVAPTFGAQRLTVTATAEGPDFSAQVRDALDPSHAACVVDVEQVLPLRTLLICTSNDPQALVCQTWRGRHGCGRLLRWLLSTPRVTSSVVPASTCATLQASRSAIARSAV
jgi:hypothetical protein